MTYRTDLLPHKMNSGKEAKVRALLAAWRDQAVRESRVQWRLFFARGHFSKGHDVSRNGYEMVGARFGQMVRWQVVGQLESWLSGRANEFRTLVNGSTTLSPDVRHQLHFINTWHAWVSPATLTMKDGTVIPAETRRLARTIFRHLRQRHRKPDLSKVGMLLDQRVVTLTPAKTASAFPLWVRLSTLTKGKRIDVPLQTYPYFDAREGERSKSIQVFERDGKLVLGVMTNVTGVHAAARAAYRPRTEAVALDLGLRTLFATDQGDLLGRAWLPRLERYDAQLSRLAAYRRKHGLPVSSPRYRRLVARLRGFLRSEVGRVLNRLIEVHAPAEIVVERLDFRNCILSRRMNRLLSWMGRSAVKSKLKDLTERLGVRIIEVNPAYSSQEDSGCGYVDKKNRPRQEAFCCRWCGAKRHADVNAARNLLRRRSDAVVGDRRRPKHAILVELVRRFNERHAGARGSPADPPLSNPYFIDRAVAVT